MCYFLTQMQQSDGTMQDLCVWKGAAPGGVCGEGKEGGDSTEGGHHSAPQHSIHHLHSSAPHLHAHPLSYAHFVSHASRWPSQSRVGHCAQTTWVTAPKTAPGSVLRYSRTVYRGYRMEIACNQHLAKLIRTWGSF